MIFRLYYYIMKKYIAIIVSLCLIIWYVNSYEISDFLDMLKNGADLNDLIENANSDINSTDSSSYNTIVERYNTLESYDRNNTHQNDSAWWAPSDIMNNWYTRELNDAYQFAYDFGITTQNSIFSANMQWWLNRIAMAKMLSEFAVNVLGLTYDSSTCYFSDISQDIIQSYDDAACKAYFLGIMWQNMANNQFRPFDIVTRAEFATALSRLLYNTPDGRDVYYSTHLSKLYDEWIISNTNPNLHEVRWYVMLMLMRATNN